MIRNDVELCLLSFAWLVSMPAAASAASCMCFSVLWWNAGKREWPSGSCGGCECKLHWYHMTWADFLFYVGMTSSQIFGLGLSPQYDNLLPFVFWTIILQCIDEKLLGPGWSVQSFGFGLYFLSSSKIVRIFVISTSLCSFWKCTWIINDHLQMIHILVYVNTVFFLGGGLTPPRCHWTLY